MKKEITRWALIKLARWNGWMTAWRDGDWYVLGDQNKLMEDGFHSLIGGPGPPDGGGIATVISDFGGPGDAEGPGNGGAAHHTSKIHGGGSGLAIPLRRSGDPNA